MKEWAQTVFNILVLFALLMGLLWLKAINDRAAANTAAQAQQAAEWQVFLRGFTAESNYDCEVLWYLNHQSSGVPLAPSISVCRVTVP